MRFCKYCLIIFLTTCLQTVAQELYFEGSVTYQISEFDKFGKPISTPIDSEEVSFTSNVILTRPLSGPLLVFRTADIYLNSETGERYSIDHVNKLIKNLGIVSDVENIVPLEERRLGHDKVNEISCEVNYIKYVHQYIDSNQNVIYDTLRCTYYNSENLLVSQLEKFCSIQGNRNTYFLNGRYRGIPLRIIIEKRDGSIMRIESKEVKKASMIEIVKLPNYPLEK